LVEIGNHCTITSGVHLITHDGGLGYFVRKCRNLMFLIKSS